MQEISVFLFLGFLDSGKTAYIRELLENPEWETGERTMLLVCEEGDGEYDAARFAVKNVVKITLEGVEELTLENLERLNAKHRPQRVFVEYNGTWLLQQFFEAMPESWVINQMLTLFDATTFLNYNANMRQLVFDKVQMTQLVAFNRYKKEYDKMEFHKVVRGISRRPDIVFEYTDGNIELDDIVDPLPFDINAPIIEIEDRDFAWFYRDMAENTAQYAGKTVRFKGMAAVTKKVPAGYVVLGRHIMTCCEADIAYDGFAVKTNGLVADINTRDWLIVTAKIKIEYSPIYRSKGPVLIAEKLERCEPPEERVVTYY